ncbi:MAG: hypothetical protein ACREC1_08710 [Methylovirgula sp.]
MRIGCLVASIMLAASQNAAGSEITIFGVGNSSCGTWVDAHKAAPGPIASTQDSWVFGYVAAFSTLTHGMGAPDASDVADGGGMIHWMSNYCALHPLDTIYKAADALTAELIDRVTRH